MNIKIVSGAQTGVDQGVLEAAGRLGLEFGGWAPARWLAEKPLGAVPEAYRVVGGAESERNLMPHQMVTEFDSAFCGIMFHTINCDF